MFAYLFGILLFNSDRKDNDAMANKNQLHYTTLLEKYLLTQLKNNRELVSQRLGVTIEMICSLK